MKTLNSISSSNGISISKLSNIISKTNKNIIKNRLVDFIKMYENNPERFNRLVKSYLD